MVSWGITKKETYLFFDYSCIGRYFSVVLFKKSKDFSVAINANSSTNKVKRKIFYNLIIIITLMALNSFDNESLAQNKTDSVIKIKSCNDFEITGTGSSEVWERTAWINIPQRSDKPITYITKAKVLYSETGLYFLFDCEDKKLIATMNADNLDLWEEDVVEVFLWTKEDFPVYFEYELSPLNYELPILVPNYKGDFLGWLPWHYEGNKRTRHATSVREGNKESGGQISAWVAEFFIPYKLLSPLQQVPPKSGTIWRANMYRIDYDQGITLFSWQKIESTYHEYNKFGTFIFE